ncbi:DUF4168 domain-containing protein [Salinimicrobium marinum]|nr:DUF4168 domain-containing protein [Salinimicrobium marinum]
MSFTTKGITGILFIFLSLGTNSFAQTTPLQQSEVQQIEVSDAELEKFAQAFQRIRMINQEAQQQMMQVVQDEGMDIQRFNEIYQASMDPAVNVETTSEEQEQYSNISSEIEKMQGSFQSRMEEVITKQDMTVQRYEQIATQLQTDPQLQERLKAVFEG